MTDNSTSRVIADLDPSCHLPSDEFDLNEALRTLADSRQDECRRQNIAVILDLAAELPKTVADGEHVMSVLYALFGEAQKTILKTGNTQESIAIRTELNDEMVRLSMTHEGFVDPTHLTICAQIIQDQAGALYIWRPSDVTCTSVIMDLPV